jgi:RNA methyltransferase, TrmH family
VKPLAWYKALSTANAGQRRESGFFIVEGRRAFEQIRSTAPRSIEEVLVTEQNLPEYRNCLCPVRALTERQFKTVSVSKTPQGIAAVVKIPEKSYSNELPAVTGDRLLLLEGIQDPGNVGTLIRTAAAFDFKGILLSDECADAFSPKAVQASAGSILSVWLRRTVGYLDLAKRLKIRGCKLIAADLLGEPLTQGYRLPVPCALMFGSEGTGLSNEFLALADEKLRIPMNNRNVDSLNVAVSGAIMMFCGRK